MSACAKRRNTGPKILNSVKTLFLSLSLFLCKKMTLVGLRVCQELNQESQLSSGDPEVVQIAWN